MVYGCDVQHLSPRPRWIDVTGGLLCLNRAAAFSKNVHNALEAPVCSSIFFRRAKPTCKIPTRMLFPPPPDFSGPCPRAVVTDTPWQGAAGRDWCAGAAGRFLAGWEEVMMGTEQEELSREPGKQQEQAGVIR